VVKSVKIRKVTADVLSPAKRAAARPPSAREQRRLALEKKLERVVQEAARDAGAAFRLMLEDGEKPPTVRQAFVRVRDRLGAADVNLFTRGDAMIVARRPQRRGRRPRS
jgi:hypothetical protein